MMFSCQSYQSRKNVKKTLNKSCSKLTNSFSKTSSAMVVPTAPSRLIRIRRACGLSISSLRPTLSSTTLVRVGHRSSPSTRLTKSAEEEPMLTSTVREPSLRRLARTKRWKSLRRAATKSIQTKRRRTCLHRQETMTSI